MDSQTEMHCYICHSDDFRRSKRRWYERLVSMVLHQVPYRCMMCNARQWFPVEE